MTEHTKIIYLMGTKISLYVKGNNSEILLNKAEDMLIYYNEVFSANREDSQLSMLKKELHSLRKRWMKSFMN